MRSGPSDKAQEAVWAHEAHLENSRLDYEGCAFCRREIDRAEASKDIPLAKFGEADRG